MIDLAVKREGYQEAVMLSGQKGKYDRENDIRYLYLKMIDLS